MDATVAVCTCPSCGKDCTPEDLKLGGPHYVYTTGPLAGYCTESLFDELGYREDEMETCPRHEIQHPCDEDCPRCIEDDLIEEWGEEAFEG